MGKTQNLKCDICGKTGYRDKSNLERHLRSHFKAVKRGAHYDKLCEDCNGIIKHGNNKRHICNFESDLESVKIADAITEKM